MARDMSENAAADTELSQHYRELVEAVHMVRRAAERAIRAGVLPAIELHRTGITPLQECEAVARVLYTAAGRPIHDPGTIELAGLSPDELRFDPGAENALQSA
jgi:Xaa-Pro aminopeptidase